MKDKPKVRAVAKEDTPEGVGRHRSITHIYVQ